jgi:hypothetical protein
MGVFVDNGELDEQLLKDILGGFKQYWNGLKDSKSSGIVLEALDHNLGTVSQYAQEAFKFFQIPSYYHRIAAFLIITTVCPCFSIRAEGKLVTEKARRRWFFSRVNLLILPGLFSILRDRLPNSPQWPGNPPKDILQQIVAFLELIDVSDVVNAKHYSHDIGGLTKDIIALALIVKLWVEMQETPGSNDFGAFLRDTGLAQ